MEWQLVLILMVVSMVVLMLTGLPIAFVFLLLNVAWGMLVFSGGPTAAITQVVINMRGTLSSFTLLPVVMFVLLGEVMFRSGMGTNMLDALGKWLGRLPGRLALLAVGFSTIFATMSGSSVATAALMATVLQPEMEKRGYKKAMSIGPIMGAGGLAIIIPPSSLAVIIAVVGDISVGRLLVSGVIPGLMLATFYAIYIIGRCLLNPSLAPAYEVTLPPLSEKIRDTAKYVLPLGLIIFLVLGVIFLGIATPTESAALGAVGSLFLALCYRKLNWEMVKKCVIGTLRTSAMVYLIIGTAGTFSQVLSFSGATTGLVRFASYLSIPPMMVIIGMMFTVALMGCFMDVTAIIFISMPIFMPVIRALGFDPVWFGLLMLINMEMALITPPFGMLLFVMQGRASAGTTMGDIIRAGFPFVICEAAAIAVIIAFPVIAQWLPKLML